jgi:hypothetical protein
LKQFIKKDSWSRLCQRAGVLDDFEMINEKTNLFSYWKVIQNSTSYFNFILNIAKSGFNIEINDFNENEK